jgi:hypothetical protein
VAARSFACRFAKRRRRRTAAVAIDAVLGRVFGSVACTRRAPLPRSGLCGAVGHRPSRTRRTGALAPLPDDAPRRFQCAVDGIVQASGIASQHLGFRQQGAILQPCTRDGAHDDDPEAGKANQ